MWFIAEADLLDEEGEEEEEEGKVLDEVAEEDENEVGVLCWSPWQPYVYVHVF